MQENKISGKLLPWMIMSMEKCLLGGKNGRIKYLAEKIREINVVQPNRLLKGSPLPCAILCLVIFDYWET